MQDFQRLSDNDSQVLSQIFDPESAPTGGIVIDETLPPDWHIQDHIILSQLKARELEAITCIEAVSHLGDEAVDDTRKHNAYLKSWQFLSLLIDEHPQYASARNNRAQLARWRYGDHLVIQGSGSVRPDALAAVAETVLADLDTAITLARPASTSSSLSPSQAKLLAQAHTQRAALFYTASKDLEALGNIDQTHGNSLHALNLRQYEAYTAEMFEEASAKDFFLGGSYGNEIGKAMAVHTNPYAKMCGNIMKEAMRREFSPAFAP